MKTKTSARVFLIDDHPIFREGLAHLLSKQDDLMICGEAGNSLEGKDGVRRTDPDLVIVDLSLEGLNGIEVVKDIRGKYPKKAILVLSMHDEGLFAERLIRAGANGYVMKKELPEVLLKAIRSVLRGDLHTSDRLSTRILKKVLMGDLAPTDNPLECLSDREMEVFQMLGEGLGTRQIAERLFLSVKTIETYRDHLRKKLDFPNSRELFRFAVQEFNKDK